MKTIIKLNLPFGKRLIFQKGYSGSYHLYLCKREKNTSRYLDSMERPFTSKDTNDTKALIQQIAFNEKNSAQLSGFIIEERRIVDKTQVTYNDIYMKMFDIVTSTPVKDISEPIPKLTEEKKDHNKVALKSILNNEPI